MTHFQTLTVYLGSSGHCRPVFKQATHMLAQQIAERGKKLVYGGMDAGLMGELALSALEGGAHVTGIIPRKLKDSERVMPGLSETIMVEDLWERKKRMFDMAEAIIALPGGFGTLDETCEALHWGYLGLHNTPVVFVNIEGYYTPLLDYFKTLPDYDPRYVLVAESVEDILPMLERTPPLERPAQVLEHFPHFEDEITRGTKEPIIIDQASMENTYFLVSALGLKQLNRTQRAIGLHNKGGQFEGLVQWLMKAAQEHFITDHCLKLFEVDAEHDVLEEKLAAHVHEVIDLHHEKWGPSVTKSP